LHLAERLELSDTMHDEPMQSDRPNGVRSSDWFGILLVIIIGLSPFWQLPLRNIEVDVFDAFTCFQAILYT
jgi:hypothetical protein